MRSSGVARSSAVSSNGPWSSASTSFPTSCRRAATASSSRSASLASSAILSVACRVATAWRRNRSWRSAVAVGCSKGSYVWIPSPMPRIRSTLSTSTAWRTPRVRPCGPPPLLAARITWIARAASDSMAAATSSPDGADASLARRRRCRASASAGIDETVSNAAARRFPPCPLLRSRVFDAGFVFGRAGADPVRFRDREPLSLVAALVMGISTRTPSSAVEPWGLAIGCGFPPHSAWVGAPSRAVSGVEPVQRRLDPAHGLLAAERRERVKDARRHGGARDRDANRLVDVLRLAARPLDDWAERFLHGLRREAVGLPQGVEGLRQRIADVRLHHPLPGSRVVDGLGEEEADERPRLIERLCLVADDLACRAAKRGRGRAVDGRVGLGMGAQVLGKTALVLLERQLPHVTPVHPAELARVEDGRGAADALDGEPLDQLLRGDERRVVLGPPAKQRQVVADSGG